MINQNIKQLEFHSRYFVAFWYLVFEMGGIALDKAIIISMILESLLYGSRHKPSSSCSITNKLESGIFTVMFGFILWVLIHERGRRINMKLLLPSLALYALATMVSQLTESMSWMCLNASSIWPSTYIGMSRLSLHTEMHPVALLLISTIYRVQATSSKIRFTFYKLCWATSAW